MVRKAVAPIEVATPATAPQAAPKSYADSRILRQAAAPADTTALWIDTDDDTADTGIPLGIVDAKGDLIVGSADNAVVRLPIGAVGSSLEARAAGTVAWQEAVRGMIVPNAAVGTNVTQAAFPGATWARMYGANLYKIGDYFQGATLVNHADGAQYVQIDHAGLYLFEVMFSGNFPSSSEIGYGLTTKAEFDAAIPYKNAHNHEKPYVATADYKVRAFQRYCNVGDLVCPTFYMNGATGNMVHNNQPQTRAHFSFVRVSA